MCTPVFGTGRNLTIDNWFTSYDIIKKMKTGHNITIVGTVRKNKRELPPQFVSAKNREPHSSLFGFQEDMTLVSYIPKKGKTVVLFSSMHNDDKIDDSTGEMRKPDIITFYNATKGGVFYVDERMSSYNVARNTRRWTMVIFYAMLNIVAFNSYLILRSNNPESTEIRNRRQFLKRLMIDLTHEQMKRANCQYLPNQFVLQQRRLQG